MSKFIKSTIFISLGLIVLIADFCLFVFGLQDHNALFLAVFLLSPLPLGYLFAKMGNYLNII